MYWKTPHRKINNQQSTLTGDHDALRFTATTPGHQTQQDAELSELRDIIMTKWPDKRADCLARLHGYWNYRDEMSVNDGIILKGYCIVIPLTLRQPLYSLL